MGGFTVKVAIYCRVSTEEQTTENQRITLTEYADRQGWQYEVYVETESTRNTRPVKEQLLKALRDGFYNAVLVYKIDRWARSLTELSLNIKELFDRGVKFISLQDNIDLTTATGRLQFNVFAALAEFERDLISERTKEGLKRAKREGKRLGRPKGSKDKKVRKKGGYYLRHINKNGSKH